VHPARFPSLLPEYFLRMLTDKGDTVFDPFAGSFVTGAVAESLGRRWIGVEMLPEHVEGARGRFVSVPVVPSQASTSTVYEISTPCAAAAGRAEEPLPPDGGRSRQAKARPEKRRA